jgi:single-strand DNA-binding protein
MRTYNRATVIGHVGNDVVLRYTQSGQAVTNLSLATNERRKDGPEVTTWHRVVLWGRLAEIAEKYVRKGEPVYVEGPLCSRQWTDKEGETHFRTELSAKELIFLGSRGEENDSDKTPRAQTSTAPAPANDGEERSEIVEDVPF